MRFLEPLVRGRLVARKNRFVVAVRVGDQDVQAHLANSGRLRELVIPGDLVYLAPCLHAGRQCPYATYPGVIAVGVGSYLPDADTPHSMVGTVVIIGAMTFLPASIKPALKAGKVEAVLVAGAYLVLAWRDGQANLAALCAIMIGAILAFLWFNSHPAQVFMGDAGSLALGAALGTVALLSNWVILLPVIGFVLVVDLASVILQVAYFKATGGRRIFRMSPIHHHFELAGWSEVQVVQRFWVAAALMAALGVGLATVR